MRCIVFLCVLLLSACAVESGESNNSDTVKKVEIKNIDGQYTFVIDGKPFKVKGVGLDSDQGRYFKELKEAGANTFRTWRTNNADIELAAAKEHGLMVAMGLDIHKELHGFDFNDEKAVAEQFERLKKRIDKYKDHPNVLCWVAGNELNLLFDEKGGLKLVNPKTYTALADIVDYIHEVDPNHPVTTTFAGMSRSHVDLALKHCPQLDFMSYQIYGGLGTLPEITEKSLVDRPFMITEFGPVGHWELPSTEWGREIEQNSQQRADGMAQRITKGLEGDNKGLCMGGFAFLWGQKQERTPTWYGVFNKDGKASASVDELTKWWTGSYPKNRAPVINEFTLNGKIANDNIYVKPGEILQVKASGMDRENNPLSFNLNFMTEVKVKSDGGAFEKEPEVLSINYVDVKNISNGPNAIKPKIKAPEKEGDYRLFLYLDDGNGKVANANIPFYVKK